MPHHPSRAGANRLDAQRRVDALEPLEPRRLLTSYGAAPLSDAYRLPTGASEQFVVDPAPGAGGFGAAVVVLGDVNADGADDFAVAAPGRAASGPDHAINGAVYLYSGRDQALLRTLAGNAPGFGDVLARAQDLDSDGVFELFVGSPSLDRAGVYSPVSGVLYRDLVGDAGSEFGRSFAPLDDVNADGAADFAVGAPARAGVGAVVILSGLDGALIRRIDGWQAGSRFGHAVAQYLDVRPSGGAPDGVREILIGAPDYDDDWTGTPHPDSGAFYLYNGATGVLWQSYVNAREHEHLGQSLGVDDDTIYLGAPAGVDAPSGYRAGTVYRVRPSLPSASVPLRTPTVFQRGLVSGERFGLKVQIPGTLQQAWTSQVLVGALGIARTGAEGDQWLDISAPRVVVGDFDADTIPDLLGFGGSAQPESGVAFSSARLYPLAPAEGFSPGGTYAYSSTFRTGQPVSAARYIATADSFLPLTAVPALAAWDHRITAIGENGVVGAVGNFTVPFLVDPANPSVRVMLTDLVETVVGNDPGDYGTFLFSRMDDGAGALLRDLRTFSLDGGYGVWLLRDGTLTFLWEGYATDIAPDGTILGVRQSGQSYQAVIRSPEGVITELDHMSDVWRFGPDMAVLGRSHLGELVRYDDGVYSLVRGVPALSEGDDATALWSPIGFDSAGRAAVHLYMSDSGPAGEGPFTRLVDLQVSDTDGVPFRLAAITDPTVDDESIFGTPSPNDFLSKAVRSRVLLLPDGRIVTPSHVLTPTGVPGQIEAAPGLTAAPGADGPVVLGETALGVPMGLVPDDQGGWTARAYPQLDGAPLHAAFLDPKDGRTYVLAVGGILQADGGHANAAVYRVLDDGALADQHTIAISTLNMITSVLHVFVSADGRVHAVGFNDYRDLVMIYQTGEREIDGSWRWSVDNITLNHLLPQGLPNPAWGEGGLTSYVAPWNGLNIAGLDTGGAVHVVWWAPGRTLWSVVNLSDVTGVGPLAGGLAGYSTPWGGLNLAGVDTDGDLRVLWWVPGFGAQWRVENMTDQLGMQIATPSAFVTRWGGLNIAGIDRATARPAVLWWAPGMTSWIATVLPVESSGGSTTWPDADQPLVPVVRGDESNLISTGGADVIRLSWRPGDAETWTLENLSVLAG